MESPPKRQKISSQAVVIDLLDSPVPPARPVNRAVQHVSTVVLSESPSATQKENRVRSSLPATKKEDDYITAPRQPAALPAMPPSHRQPSSTVPLQYDVQVLDVHSPVKRTAATSGKFDQQLTQLHRPSPLPLACNTANTVGLAGVTQPVGMPGSGELTMNDSYDYGGWRAAPVVSGQGAADIGAAAATMSVGAAHRGLLRAAGVPTTQLTRLPSTDPVHDEAGATALTQDPPLTQPATQNLSTGMSTQDMTMRLSQDCVGGSQQERKLEFEEGKPLSKKEAAALLKAQKAAAREEERKRKAAEKEQQKLEKELQKQKEKEAKQQKALQEQQEKATKKAAKELERQSKGKNAMNEIVVLIDRQAATEHVFWEIMGRLKEEQSVNHPPFKCEIEDLPMAPLHSIAFKRVLPSALTQTEAFSGSQGAYMPLSQGSQGYGSQGVGSQDQMAELPVPYILLVFHDCKQFIDEMVKDNLRSVINRALQHHPEATLGILTVGLEKALTDRERKDPTTMPGGGLFNRQHVEDACVQLMLSCPAVRFKHTLSSHEAADYVRDVTRALAEQPYKARASLLESYHGTNNNSTRDMQLKVDHLPPNSANLAKALHAAKGLNLGPNQCAIVAERYGSLSKLMTMMSPDNPRPMVEVLEEIGNEKLQGTNRKFGLAAAQKLHLFLTADDPDMLTENAS